ncbi:MULTISPECIES: hypothetical protein [Streptomyces]|uniref:Allene oxide cyclase barrel-like domain-containing protein n=1 Tax=Streptomyces caniscabiei TaxID=2746961 RepID=A0ABU4MVM6_9ACTN|nr:MULTISPECIES: hypothetical protein [Streptomyces]MBE4733856.1 hypothetical protein [Streptomyces caniscabiei]MBE4755033.1 hypothetical protein [Streptomyces caniscabiei]MBE4768147.1 hypothetical protein [Streptomyces caniscabiei]MBE4782351.1 hypothetical protein [Streptomyces caniscabiei]MBE4793639.1 hypothetical protein [Streptomyces caniscabiei]
MPSATARGAVTLGALAAALATSLSAPAAADVGDEDVVRVKLVGQAAHDTAAAQTEPGDSWTTYLHLHDPKGKYVGDGGSRCTLVEANRQRSTAQCTRVLRLKGGEITLHDMISRKGDERVTAKTSIAGGTGIYNDAEGEGYITVEPGRFVFDLYVDD